MRAMAKIRKKYLRCFVLPVCACVVAAALSVPAFLMLDHAWPPPLPDRIEVSKEVVDADGRLLRSFATGKGRWRLPVVLDDVDSEFLKLLIAYEDQRFWTHHGVDPLAMVRAAGQLVANGRIISGGSTITMQLARLAEPRSQRSVTSKLLQIFRALQIERRLSKKEILERYLLLAPYGGNLEGVRAASLAYFGREPKGLTLAQAAMLVALPQSPEGRRPDRHAGRAKRARDTVLSRMAAAGVIASGEVERATSAPVPDRRFALPQLAAHLAQRALVADPEAQRHQVTLKRDLQQALEAVAGDAVRQFDRSTSVALLLADAKTGDVLAHVGSPDTLDAKRSGWVDMTGAIRSPGSTLKPFIYGLAFEEGVARPETLMTDGPASFAGYRPRNFDMEYQGEISARKALQLSLNVPAIQLLEAVGPARLLARFRRAQVEAVLPAPDAPGLAIGLGGIGVSLRDLVQLYTAFANGGRVRILRDGVSGTGKLTSGILQPGAAWQVADILSGAPTPPGAHATGLSYKTGTSYGYRDAWAIGFDGRYVLGVWVGKADNGPVPGITGFGSAAPILFDAFARSGLKTSAPGRKPAAALVTSFEDLPAALKRFQPLAAYPAAGISPEPPPRIIHPPTGAYVELAMTARGEPVPLVIKLQGGRPPFRWLANGNLVPMNARKRKVAWKPDGSGYSTLTVIDATGRASSVNVFVQAH